MDIEQLKKEIEQLRIDLEMEKRLNRRQSKLLHDLSKRSVRMLLALGVAFSMLFLNQKLEAEDLDRMLKHLDSALVILSAGGVAAGAVDVAVGQKKRREDEEDGD